MKLRLPFPTRSRPLLRTALPGFDALWYGYWYRDVAAHPAGPLDHYLRLGWREGRDPSAGFSADGYLRANPDVRDADLNPLLHYLENGLAEGRTGHARLPSAPAPKPRPPAPLMLTAPTADRST